VDSPTCDSCGSQNLRRAHAHSRLRRLYRRLTGQTRYHCQACHHRGWTDLPLQPRDGQGRAVQAGPGRRSERRDLVARRVARARVILAVLVAVALGTLVALLLSRPGD